MIVNVLTYNIHSGIGTDGQFNLERIGEVIRSSNADIVGLNEVDCLFHKRSKGMDEPLWLSNYLQMHYTFAPGIRNSSFLPWKKGGFGNVLLSKFPIVSMETIPLIGWMEREEPRSLLKACIDTGTGILQVAVTHLGLNEKSRKIQMDKVLASLQPNRPTIVMGDWNAKPDEISSLMMNSIYKDVWKCKGIGEGYTFSSDNPKARIDYIYVSSHFCVEEARVVTEAGEASDHFPLYCAMNIAEIKPSAIRIQIRSRP